MNKNLTLFFKDKKIGHTIATNNYTTFSYDEMTVFINVDGKNYIADLPMLKKAKDPIAVMDKVVKDIISSNQSFGYLEHFVERHLDI